ncbi:hypothetical protein B0H67DRAFT_121994 [Lasiosphaeris hirsuta]|uniref:Uncharacterized protein n=1 Tax=Lasiosphaeris hirsuta TaxID=260670 RepID=A0AA40E239_9PEZI|nr:hypothetical protein B0H67DRAFT_121994 [Lasiosphaeris hirsuta]
MIAGRWSELLVEGREDFLGERGLHNFQFSARRLVPAYGCSDKNADISSTSARYRTTWLSPYLGIPVLSNSPLELFNLLHVRTEHHPSTWAVFDFQHAALARRYEVLNTYFHPKALAITPRDFGQLVDWSKWELHGRQTLGFNGGIYTLAAMESVHSSSSAALPVTSSSERFLNQYSSQTGTSDTTPSTPPPLTWLQLIENGFSSLSDPNPPRVTVGSREQE